MVLFPVLFCRSHCISCFPVSCRSLDLSPCFACDCLHLFLMSLTCVQPPLPPSPRFHFLRAAMSLVQACSEMSPVPFPVVFFFLADYFCLDFFSYEDWKSLFFSSFYQIYGGREGSTRRMARMFELDRRLWTLSSRVSET